ncbi:MAG TPA: GAF domain-containing protein [Pirellulaceae bacterium]|nr:GAF domain-containing protein [Pirellulaceae bacterium]
MAHLRILYVCSPGDSAESLPAGIRESAEIVTVHNPLRALGKAAREKFDGVYVAADHLQSAVRLGRLLENDRILESMPDAVALLDPDQTILWANNLFLRWCNRGNVVGDQFYLALGNPEVVGTDESPLRVALKTGLASGSLLKTAEGRFYQLHAAPISDPEAEARHLVVSLRDVTHEALQHQKLAAIQDAGRELADLKPEEIFQMPVEERVELIKSNILHCTKDLLRFDVVEIRLLDQKTGQLVPLLEDGMDPEAAQRVLYAREQGNGVTGFVAATGKSYLCEDTASDPYYLTGVAGAKSSLTVPLKLHNEVIGTFNVESPQPHAFNDADLQFLQIFCRDVAMSMNTLQLLAAQQMDAAQSCAVAIHGQVALPIDEIVTDAAFVTEHLRDIDTDLRARLEKILTSARGIKEAIQQVGRTLAPTDAVPVSAGRRENLRGKRVLVVDGDRSIRTSAHSLLERHDCVVETAQRGSEAESLYRHSLGDGRYHAIIAGVKLPDMSAYDLMMILKPMVERLPLILTQASEWDSGHTVVKCREAGLHPAGWIIKPFKERQLLDTVETIIGWSESGKV